MAALPLADLVALREAWLSNLTAELTVARGVREQVHADPCLSGDEEPTADLVADALEIPMQRIAGTGRIGRIGPQTGPAVMLRAEMDALPIEEATGARIAYITRLGEGILPRPDTVHQEGDLVHLVIPRDRVPDVERILDGQPPQEV